MLLSELEFGAFLTYSPHGTDGLAVASQLWVRRLKDERLVGIPPVPMSEYVAARLQVRLLESDIQHVLTPSAVLVPVPSSAKLKYGSLWVPFLLAKAMVARGLASDVQPCLERVTPVRKSATSPAMERPTADDHHRSIKVTRLEFPPSDIVLIDDVVTRGATLLAAASRVREIAPEARITAFAIVRTMSNREDFVSILDPCRGRITLREDGQTFRRP